MQKRILRQLALFSCSSGGRSAFRSATMTVPPCASLPPCLKSPVYSRAVIYNDSHASLVWSKPYTFFRHANFKIYVQLQLPAIRPTLTGAVQILFFTIFEQVVTKVTTMKQSHRDFHPKNYRQTRRNAKFWPRVQNWGTIFND